MTLKPMWSPNFLILGILLSLFACQIPGEVVRVVSQTRRTVTPTNNSRATIPVAEAQQSPYPGVTLGTSYPAEGTEESYPKPEGTLQSPDLVPVTGYPGSMSQSVTPEETIQSHSEITGSTSYPINETNTPPTPGTSDVSTRESIESVTTTTETTGGHPYPDTENQPTNTSYPGAESSTGLNLTQYPAYPGTGEGTPDASPSPTFTVSSTTKLTGTQTSNRTPEVTSTATPRRSTSSTSTPIPTVFSAPTATLTPTKTPFLTPTPTSTPTPTNTRTPMPFPPWISSKLSATDPSTVRLASGKIQLVEFFAYWSGPSQAMAPLLLGLKMEYRDRVNFIYLDIDNPANITFKRQLGFRMEPQFFLLDPQGKILKQWIGYVTVEQLRMAFDTALQ